jgi:hypothetical protein
MIKINKYILGKKIKCIHRYFVSIRIAGTGASITKESYPSKPNYFKLENSWPKFIMGLYFD